MADPLEEDVEFQEPEVDASALEPARPKFPRLSPDPANVESNYDRIADFADRSQQFDLRQRARDQRKLEIAQRRERNAVARQHNEETGAQYRTDANGDYQPVVDPGTGKQKFTPRVTPVRFDEKGRPFQVRTSETGATTVEDPDAKAPYGENPDDPKDRFIYRQTKATPWEPIDPEDGIKSGNRPLVAASAKFLHKRELEKITRRQSEIKLQLKDPEAPGLSKTERAKIEEQISSDREPIATPAAPTNIFGFVNAEAAARSQAEWAAATQERQSRLAEYEALLINDDERKKLKQELFDLEKQHLDLSTSGAAGFLQMRRKEAADKVAGLPAGEAQTEIQTGADELGRTDVELNSRQKAIQDRTASLNAEMQRGVTSERADAVDRERASLAKDQEDLQNAVAVRNERAADLTAAAEAANEKQKSDLQASRQSLREKTPALAPFLDELDAADSDAETRLAEARKIADPAARDAALKTISDEHQKKAADIQSRAGAGDRQRAAVEEARLRDSIARLPEGDSRRAERQAEVDELGRIFANDPEYAAERERAGNVQAAVRRYTDLEKEQYRQLQDIRWNQPGAEENFKAGNWGGKLIDERYKAMQALGISGEEFDSAIRNQRIQDAFDSAGENKLNLSDKWNEITENPVKLLPFIGSAPELGAIGDVLESARKVEQGKGTNDDYAALAQFAAQGKQDKDRWYKVADIISHLPGFALELLATGGFYSAGKSAALKGGSAVLKKLAGEGAAKWLTEAAGRKLIGSTARELTESLAVKSAVGLAGSAAQAPIAGALRIPAGFGQRITPQIEQVVRDQRGDLNFIMRSGEAPLQAAINAAGDQYVEVFSEHTGGAFDIAGKILGKVLPQKLRSTLTKAFLFGKWSEKTGGDPKGFAKFLREAGWNGVFQEIGEERVGDLARGFSEFVQNVAQGQGLADAAGNAYSDNAPTGDQLLTELIAFSIPGAAVHGTQALADKNRSPAELPKGPAIRPEQIAAVQAQADNWTPPASLTPEGAQVERLAVKAAIKVIAGQPLDSLIAEERTALEQKLPNGAPRMEEVNGTQVITEGQLRRLRMVAPEAERLDIRDEATVREAALVAGNDAAPSTGSGSDETGGQGGVGNADAGAGGEKIDSEPPKGGTPTAGGSESGLPGGQALPEGTPRQSPPEVGKLGAATGESPELPPLPVGKTGALVSKREKAAAKQVQTKLEKSGVDQVTAAGFSRYFVRREGSSEWSEAKADSAVAEFEKAGGRENPQAIRAAVLASDQSQDKQVEAIHSKVVSDLGDEYARLTPAKRNQLDQLVRHRLAPELVTYANAVGEVVGGKTSLGGAGIGVGRGMTFNVNVPDLLRPANVKSLLEDDAAERSVHEEIGHLANIVALSRIRADRTGETGDAFDIALSEAKDIYSQLPAEVQSHVREIRGADLKEDDAALGMEFFRMFLQRDLAVKDGKVVTADGRVLTEQTLSPGWVESMREVFRKLLVAFNDIRAAVSGRLQAEGWSEAEINELVGRIDEARRQSVDVFREFQKSADKSRSEEYQKAYGPALAETVAAGTGRRGRGRATAQPGPGQADAELRDSEGEGAGVSPSSAPSAAADSALAAGVGEGQGDAAPSTGSGSGETRRQGENLEGVDGKAAEADPNPTDAQKEAGNYRMGHVRISGLDITIENPAGSERMGRDGNGKEWSVTMAAHYGYIRGTDGTKDGDHLDVFIKPGTPEDWTGTAYVVNQVKPGNSHFDEHKVVLGAASLEEARDLYLSNYAADWKGIGDIAELPWDQFKDWALNGDLSKALEVLDEGQLQARNREASLEPIDEAAVLAYKDIPDEILSAIPRERADLSRAFQDAAKEIESRRGNRPSEGPSGIGAPEDVGSWASEKGLLVPDSDFESLPLVSNSTSEHEVFFRPSDDRALKRTWPGFYGQIPVPDNGKVGRKNAEPSEYLRRMALQIAVFQSDLRLEGVNISDRTSLIIGQKSGEPSMVVSQEWVETAGAPSMSEIADRLKEDGFESIPNAYYGWYRPADGVVIVDAKPDNFTVTANGIIPLDLQMAVFTPDELRRAGLKWMPAATAEIANSESVAENPERLQARSVEEDRAAERAIGAGLVDSSGESGGMPDADRAGQNSAASDEPSREADYRIDHRPMTDAGGASRLHDLTSAAFDENIYNSNALQYYGSGDPREANVVRILKSLKGKPDAKVTIYRGAPANVDRINPGDWVTLDRGVAEDYAELVGGRVVSKEVSAKEVTAWADSLLEFGYLPESPESRAPKVGAQLQARSEPANEDLAAAKADGAKDPIVRFREYLPEALKIAGGFANITDQDEARQQARLALADAARTYEARFGRPFAAYAGVVVRNRLRRLYRQEDTRHQRFPVSLDEPIGEDGESTRSDLVPDGSTPAASDGASLSEARSMLDQVLSSLPRPMAVAARGYLDQRTLDEIGEDLGVSAQRASVVQREAFRRMRGQLGERGVSRVEQLLSRPEESDESLEAEIEELMRGLDQEIADWQAAAISEEASGGVRTIGRPDLAHGADNADVRGADEWYTGQFQPETEEQWWQKAEQMLAADYEGTRRAIERAGFSGQSLTPVQTKAAETIATDLRNKMLREGTVEARRAFNRFWIAYRGTGTAAGRALAARRDPAKTPAERHAEFLMDLMLKPRPAAQREIDAAPSSAEVADRIKALEKQLQNARDEIDAARVRSLEQQIEAERAMPTKERLIDEETKALLDKLKANGITPEDILKERVTLRLADRKIINDFLQLLARGSVAAKNARQRAFRMILSNRGFADIAKATGLSETAVKQLKTDFIAQMRAQHFAKFQAGAKADAETIIGSGAKVPDAQAEAEFTKWLRGLGIVEDSKQGRPKFNIEDPAHVMRMARAIQAATRAGITDMLYEWWIMNILSGPQTQVVNIAGNSLNAAWDMTLQRGMESLVNLAVRDSRAARFGEFKWLLKGLLPGMAKGLSLGAKAWAAEHDFFEHTILGTPLEIGQFDKAGNVRAAIPGKLGRIIRIPGRALLFTDSFFKTALANAEVAAQAYRIGRAEGLRGRKLADRIAQLSQTRAQVVLEGLSKARPDKEMVEYFARTLAKKDSSLDVEDLINDTSSTAWEMAREQTAYDEAVKYGWTDVAWQRAVEKGQELTFQQELRSTEHGGNVVEDLARKLQDMRGGNLLLSFFFPFVRTPYNIFRMGIRKSPLGTANLLAQTARGLYGLTQGKPYLTTHPELVRDLSEQVIAWAAFALVYAAVQGDEDDDQKWFLITGSMPFNMTSRGERELQERAYGGEYIIRFGGRNGWTFHYGRYDPIATVLGTTVDMIRAIKSRGATADDLDALWGYMVAQAQSKTFLGGFTAVAKLLSGDTDVSLSPGRFLAQALVPNLFRQPLRNLDEYVRDSKTAPLEYQALPSGDLAMPKNNVYGEPVRKEGSPVMRLFIRTPLEADAELQQADRLLLSWNLQNPSDKYAPQAPKDTFRRNGKDVKMTPDQYYRFSQAAGRMAKALLRGKFTARQMANPKKEDVEEIRKAFDQAREQARERMFPIVKA